MNHNLKDSLIDRDKVVMAYSAADFVDEASVKPIVNSAKTISAFIKLLRLCSANKSERGF
jgi:hypothetical protein